MTTASLVALTLSGLALATYLAMQLVYFWAMRRARKAYTAGGLACAPSVTILKPLAGADDDLEANLASFASLDYPAFEILFGVASLEDAALPAARRFLDAHPHVHARIVVTDPSAATNPKVAQLLGLETFARGEVMIISDSNVRVGKEYLWPLVRELADPKVGLVTSIFSGTGERTFGAALENLQLGAFVAPGIVAYNAVSRCPLTLGKSMAFRRRDLERLGGFAPVGDVLAEDHKLGRRFLAAGFEVRTSLDTIENRNVGGGVYRTIERHARWAKMRRAIAPIAFIFEPISSPLSTAALLLPLAPTRAQLAVCLLAALVQIFVGRAVLRDLRGHGLAWYYAPLEVLRTFVALGCWMLAWFSRRVEWRAHAFVLGRDSALLPAPVRQARATARLTAALAGTTVCNATAERP